jgi:hypothetical protein
LTDIDDSQTYWEAINAAEVSGNTQQEARLRTKLEGLQRQQNNGTSSLFGGA